MISAKAIAKGLAAHSEDHPGYWVHTSGTGLLAFKDIETKSYGAPSNKVYDDWDGITEVTSLPDSAPHRNVDKIVLAAGTEHASTVNTAIVCPPTIYGQGRGPGNQRSHQVPELARCTLERKEGFQIDAGQSKWTNVHVYDLSDAYLKLVEAAVDAGGRATWGKEGYYFTDSGDGDHIWEDIAHSIARAAHKQGLIPSTKVAIISAEDADQLTQFGSVMWGSNSRGKAIRARKLLGWSPKEKSLEDDIPDVVAIEARRLGIVKGHAEKVAA